MCLKIKKIRHLNEKPKVAKRDIRCYKVFSLTDAGLASPYMETPWPRVSMAADKCIYAEPFQDTVYDMEDRWKWFVSRGIHSYRRARTARRVFKEHCLCPSTLIVECLIPKGARYWVGKRGEYCSDKLQVLI